jgi:beta-xylosidase
VNGPHQGAIVDTPQGEWWFMHFQHDGALGRVVHLQPMYWHDDWPVMGVDIDRNGIGEPVYVWTVPGKGGMEKKEEEMGVPAIPSDGYSPFTLDGVHLSPQWQ